MAEQPHPLASLDPLRVPLPHGTEVTVRVEREVAGRRVPQGAAGRVHQILDEQQLAITIVGVGVGIYRRDELVPRHPGQARFAQRRATDWEALMPCRILEATVGSQAWGLADEHSDTDRRGIFALPLPWTLGLVEAPTDLVSADGSDTYWEAEKALRQALRADPNTLELLFVPSVRALDPLGEWILAERDAFVSAQIFGSFGQYALAQLRKLQQSLRLAEHRAVVLEWLREEPAPDLDEVARRLANVTPRGTTEADGQHLAKEYVKQLYRSLYDQGLLPGRDFAALTRFARERAADFELPRELRPKNAYNLIRLIATATEWLRTGVPQLQTRGVLRDELLRIKRGEVPLAEVLERAERLTPDLEAAYRGTRLPAHPDLERAHRLLVRIGEERARRWVGQVPGPWGVNAPQAPTPSVP